MNNELLQLLEKGIVSDILAVDQAHAVLTKISKYSSHLQNESSQFDKAMGYVQRRSHETIFLAICRIFEKPHPTYPTRCILGILDYLESDIGQNLPIKERNQLASHLESISYLSHLAISARSGNNKITPQICSAYRAELIAPRVVKIYDFVKEHRDKRIAHNEDSKLFGTATWGELLSLVELAKQFVGVVGWAYVSYSYVIDGDYILTRDAQDVAYSFGELLDAVT